MFIFSILSLSSTKLYLKFSTTLISVAAKYIPPIPSYWTTRYLVYHLNNEAVLVKVAKYEGTAVDIVK